LFKLDGTWYLTVYFTQTAPLLEIMIESSCGLDKSEENILHRKEKMSLTRNTLRIICKLDFTDGLSENAMLQNPSTLQKCQSCTTVAVILENTFNVSNNLYKVWGVF